ncbi:heme ABC exporter ATP-binding protein CcmA [Roseomonas xinghualingensis]|uniref:heme ABC exporter ATP-binding protein CcmA n=1 Tax=Roseomonas xinghualingensis TaxID=2986475 RepID=UPI0021F0CCC0|nr:heme ABC exporter ATP-binding protein CcmA [Roseomonas sp. SXEYE001]MCV4207617.1 heme ABC exporter ATP-binding protein CcmA [Roseomonas sp. SXEYE001]
MQGMAGVLAADDLAARRGGRVVFAGLSLRAAPGDALLLLGANGAGKSTLLRLLAGLLRPVAGRVTWDGEDVAQDTAAHGARIRYLGHQDAIKSALTPHEDLTFWARLRGGDPHAALEALGLLALSELPCRTLSAGQRRRLALARLTLGDAPLWLLDEPTLGLDSASVARLGRLLAAHRARGGIVLAATHLPLPLPDARELAL